MNTALFPQQSITLSSLRRAFLVFLVCFRPTSA